MEISKQVDMETTPSRLNNLIKIQHYDEEEELMKSIDKQKKLSRLTSVQKAPVKTQWDSFDQQWDDFETVVRQHPKKTGPVSINSKPKPKVSPVARDISHIGEGFYDSSLLDQIDRED